MIKLLAFALLLAGCGDDMPPPAPDLGVHCGNGNVYCVGDETCVSGDCWPPCHFSDLGCN